MRQSNLTWDFGIDDVHATGVVEERKGPGLIRSLAVEVPFHFPL